VARAPRHETPIGFAPGPIRWVSDLLAEVLRGIGIDYVVQVPGSSYSGVHDSIVNHLGNVKPQLIMALHEETAVAIAHGYAKATGRMMAAALHANIGLLRAPMAIYNAWCDRAPVLILGGTGPRHEALRNVSDWIHSGSDHGGLIRGFTKWDDEPGSAAGAVEALFRASQIAQTAPCGPVFVNFVSDLQESRFVTEPTLPDFERYAPPNAVCPAAEDVKAAAELLANARHPLILLGRCSRDLRGWDERVELAERLDAPVLTQVRSAAAFPTDHVLHVAPPFFQRLPAAAAESFAVADVVLALDWTDLQDTLARAFAPGETPPKIINVSCDAHNHRGWSKDHRGLAPADVYLMCETDPAVRALLAQISPRTRTQRDPPRDPDPPGSGHTIAHVAAAVREATRDLNVCYTRLPFRWEGGTIHFRHPADYIGYDGGSGVGSGPGITVGAALGLAGDDRLAIGILGDGDFIMGNTALWTAVHYRIPVLFIVINNRSFATDEIHQRWIAAQRERAPGNEWIGCRIDDPELDLAQMARSMGAEGIGPVTRPEDLTMAIERGVAAARAGKAVVVDIWIDGPTTAQASRAFR
jgi:thiamine pyrophosphate-dependent acetolactate synthase large subunit-like protein